MSKESLEHLSGLMDGEMSRDSGMFLARRLASDEALCATWERYHLIRDCIRQPGSKHYVTGMSIRLTASLAAEQTPSVSMWQSNRWLKPVSGLAIAASVALMAIVVTAPQQVLQQSEGGDVSLAGAVNEPFVSPNILPLAPVSQPASFSATVKPQADKLNAYLLRHNQMSGATGRQSFVSFVPIVATQVTAQMNEGQDSDLRNQVGNNTPVNSDAGRKQETDANK